MILATDPTITSPSVWGPLGAFFVFGLYTMRNQIEGYKTELKEERDWNKQMQNDMINKVVPAITSSTEATQNARELIPKIMEQLGQYRAELLSRSRRKEE